MGECYGRDHLTHEEIEALGFKAVTEKGEKISVEQIRHTIFRIENPDDASGYVVRGTETTGSPTVLSYLECA